MVYDTSGVYTDPNVKIDLNQGLPNVRETWIAERNDTERLNTLTSKFGQERLKDIRTAEIRFAHIQKPRRAKAGHNVSQMHYAKQGIITLKWNILRFVKINVNVKASICVNMQDKILVHII